MLDTADRPATATPRPDVIAAITSELIAGYAGVFTAEEITAAVRSAVADLQGPVRPAALPEMAIRLVAVRLGAAGGPRPFTTVSHRTATAAAAAVLASH